MNNILLIEAKINRNIYDFDFDYDRVQLCSDKTKKKILKVDVDIDINTDDYEWIILIGSEALKFYTKQTAITQYTGRVVDEKFLPIINPAMIAFNPGAQKIWDESRDSIQRIINGEVKVFDINKASRGIRDSKEALDYIQKAIDCKDDTYIALDSETSSFYPRNGYILGLSLSYKSGEGVYIDSLCVDGIVEKKLQELFNKKIVVFHNAKFDIKFFKYHFGFKFPRFDDTMLMHYLLNEKPPHNLKYLAIRYTQYGDYDKELKIWIDSYCRKNKVKKEDFTYDLIPFDVMFPYASIDAAATFDLYNIFRNSLINNLKLKRVYNKLMIPGCKLLCDVEDNGIPFDYNRLIAAEKLMDDDIALAVKKLYTFPEIIKYEEDNKGKIEDDTFNPNSVKQLRSLLFDYIGLNPTGKKTDKGADSTDAEVLKELGKLHEIPRHILEIRQKRKIKNTYLSKIIPELDSDGRLRTNFNQHMTTSGRLSSSGKLNAQQLPRDNPIVKGCIKAKPGYSIISMDLGSAEMYFAAVLSHDINLGNIFKAGQNIHNAVAKEVFNLSCEIDEVPKFNPKERFATKAINFGIIYGAQGFTISATIFKDTGIYISPTICDTYIVKYFNRFPKLKQWIDDTKTFIEDNGFIYSHFGRKRRLPNVNSENKGIRAHEIRSGLNFVIQSIASDVNVLAAIEMNDWIKHYHFDARIFALIHDSILAEVKIGLEDKYIELLRNFTQKDRGLSIPGCPIGCDFEIGEDYSFGKFKTKYPEIANL